MAVSFNGQSTAGDVLHNVDLSGKNVLVTGATSGIGLETVRAFAAAGARVTMAVRDVTRGQDLAQGIDGEVVVRDLNLGASINSLLCSAMGRASRHSREQCRRHVTTHASAKRGWVGATVRDQPPRSLCVERAASRCVEGGAERACRRGGVELPVPNRLRRHQL